MRRWAQMSDCPRTTQSQAFAPSSLDFRTLEAPPARRKVFGKSFRWMSRSSHAEQPACGRPRAEPVAAIRPRPGQGSDRNFHAKPPLWRE
jgi:hypothetical protein